MEMKDGSDKWDCMSIRTNLVPSKIEENKDGYASEFQLIDGYFNPRDFYTASSDDFGVLMIDSDSTDDKKSNWSLLAGKSYKECKEDGLPGQPPNTFNFKFVECDIVNAHWLRNFSTDQPDEDA